MGSVSNLPGLGFLSLCVAKQALDYANRGSNPDPQLSLTAWSTTVHLVHVKESQPPIVHCSTKAPNLLARSYAQKVISSCCPVEARPGSLLRSKNRTVGCVETVAEGS